MTIEDKTSQHTYLDDLNEAQREAVCYNDGPALVIAGAGSGKTRVLVYKLLHLIYEGYDPGSLMALTFTNKAAREMRSRIELLVGPVARYIKMGTFHSIFLRLLRQHADRLGFTPTFSVYTQTDCKSKIKAIIKLMALDDSIYRPGLMLSRISNAKNRLITPSVYRNQPELHQADVRQDIPRFGELYTRYCHELKQSNAMDFDDLLLMTNILLRDHPDVLEYWRSRIEYLVIDEYQDTNYAQYNIARMLMQGRKGIFVVGDDAQSIYSFRGANIDNILSFEKSFEGAKLFKLEQNYRSSQKIVQVASELIACNKRQIPKAIYSLGEVGDPIIIHEEYSGDLEASWVTRSIETMHLTKRASYNEFAVLYRTNAQSRTLEQAFRRNNIPFRIWGGRSFFDHKEIMDVMGYFRLMVNPMDDEALLRIINYPKRGIGDTTINKVRQRAVELGLSMAEIIADPVGYEIPLQKATANKLIAFDQLIEELRAHKESERDLYALANWVMRRSGIMADLGADTSNEGKTRVENVQELLTSVEEYTKSCLEIEQEPSLEQYLSEVALMTDQDKNKDDDSRPRVTLMTIHASKGLEFPHVFIVGLEENLFPSAMSLDGYELEEERRLLYVAITRAEQTCHISYARERFRNGRTEFVRPSRFLFELPAVHTKCNTSASRSLLDAAPLHGSIQSKGSLYERGTRGDALPTGHIRTSRLLSDSLEVNREHPSTEYDLKPGDIVMHSRFGRGEVVSLESSGDDAKAVVYFEDIEQQKRLLLRYANLVKIS